MGLRTDSRATYSDFRTFKRGIVWKRELSGDQDGYKCKLVFFARRERDHSNPRLGRIRSRAGDGGQRDDGIWQPLRLARARERQRQVSERQHASNVAVAVEATRCKPFFRYAVCQGVDAVALEELVEERKPSGPGRREKR